MAHTSPLTGSRITDLADAPNGPQAFSNAVLDLEDNTVPRFATASARDSAFSTWTAAGNTLVSGLLCFTQNDLRLWRYDTASSSWLYAGGNPPPIASGTSGAGWSVVAGHPVGVYKDSAGLVHVVGSVSPGSTYNPQDGGTHTAAVLPTGYRPAATVPAILIPTSAGGTSTVVVNVDTSGVINITGGSTSSIAAGVSHFLDGITFHPGYANSVPLS